MEIVQATWPAPKNVCAFTTKRVGGESSAPYDSFNLGHHVGDSEAAYLANRNALAAQLPSAPVYLQQTHSTIVLDAATINGTPEADACFTREKKLVCAVMTADCLPVVLCDRAGTVVATAHAGWRGLADGILEATVESMGVASHELLAWFGPAIGPDSFEVGDDVRDAFLARDSKAKDAFKPHGEKWLADLYTLGRQRLGTLGVKDIYGGTYCTYQQKADFFSYRRDGVTGRMATLAYLR